MPNAFNEEVSYMTIFPETEFNNITEAYSVYGAGAFFVHLMSIVNDAEKIQPEDSFEDLRLEARRPDLWNLPITQANIDNTRPYLEKVNKLLLDYLSKDAGNSVWQDIATGKSSFISYNHDVAKIQAYLHTFGTSLKEATPWFSAGMYNNISWALAQTGMSKTDLNVLLQKDSAKGWFDNITAKGSTDIDTVKFKIITGLNDDDIYALVYNNIPFDRRSSDLPGLYINNINTDIAPIEYSGRFINLTPERLKRIQIFLTLSSKLGWDYITVNSVLNKMNLGDDFTEKNVTALAQIVYLADKWKYTAPELASLINDSFNAFNQPAGTTDTEHIKLRNSIRISAKLNVTFDRLLWFLTNPEDRTKNYNQFLNALFQLQLKTDWLETSNVHLQDYLSVLSTAKKSFLSATVFNKWYNTTLEKLATTHKHFKSTGDTTSNFDLQKVLFNQWVHEFCLFTGLQEPEVSNLLLGIFGIADINADKTALTALNKFLMYELLKATENIIEKNKAAIRANIAFTNAMNDTTGLVTKNTIEEVQKNNDTAIKALSDAKNILIVSSEANRIKKNQFFNNFLPYIILIQKLNLDVPSINFIGQYLIPIATKRNLREVKPVDEFIADIITQYKNIYRQMQVTEHHQLFIDALKAVPLNINDFALIMGWPNDSLVALYDEVKVSGKSGIYLLNQLSHCFKAATATGINVKDILTCVKEDVTGDALPIGSKNIPADRYNDYRNYWGKQLEQDRNRLVSLVLWSLNQTYSDINTADHLSDYFLCDVEMSGVMDIATLREATDAVQTYLSRCKSGLETVKSDSLKNITPEEWQWIPNFRIWQAEQMLRTYPENYLQPGLRSTATSLFKKLLDDLQENQLTHEKAEEVLLNYLDEWVDLVNADIVDVSAYKAYSNHFAKDVETMFFISKSKIKEHSFHFCYKETDTETNQTNWAQWEEIPVTINADTVSAIYAFNRLNIFWSEQSSVTDMDPSDASGKAKFTIYKLTVKCTYQNIDDSWTDPRIITSFPYYIDLVPESRLLLSVVPSYNSTCSFADARGIIMSFDVTIPSAPNTQFQVFFPGRENAGITYSPVVMTCITPATPYTKCDPVAVTLGCSELIALGPLRRNWAIGTQFTFAPPTTNPVFQSSNDWKNGAFSPANPYWKKLGLMPVSDPVDSGMGDAASYIHLFCGPLRLPAQYNYDIFLKPGVTDPKLVEFVNTFNSFSTRKKIADNIGNQNNWSNVMACGLRQLFLNQAMDTVIMSNPNEAFAYKEINAESVGFYFSNTNNGFNIQPDYYNGLPLLNYQLTYGQGNAGSHALTEGKYLFTENIKLPVKNYYAVRNRVGAFYFDLNNTGYIFSMDVPLSTMGSNKITPGNGVLELASPMVGDIAVKATGFKVERIFSTNISQLRIEGHDKGLAFLNRNIQETEIGTPRTSFSKLNPYSGYVIAPLVDSDNKISFDGAFGIYARELFFHAPMAIADMLGKNLQYEDARRWYHFVFNALGVKSGTTESIKEVWQYEPFYADTITANQKNDSTVFDPDILAQNDLNIYKRWTLEQYILFILDFADNEFRQETWESLAAATQLYFEAEDLLGQEPEVKDRLATYEEQPDRIYNTVKNDFKTISNSNIDDPKIYFGTPTNSNLKALWDRVKDRLYKLRNGLNINGERQMPSMYGTAIDPSRLLLASQNGGINPYDSSSLSGNYSVYRFRELAPHTESIINMVTEFGGQLLNALVQKDNEQLQALQATHQVNMLNVISNMYQYQVDEAAKEIDVLTANLVTVQAQLNYYQGLIDKGLLPAEIGAITANAAAAELQNSAATVRTGAVIGHLVPTVFGLADGDLQPGSAIDSLATILSEAGQTAQTISQVLSAQAEYARRAEEWQFQQTGAQKNIDQINVSIDAAKIRLSIANENLKQYTLSVSQANEILNYLSNKFTNTGLYTWMSGQMTSLYFTAYQLALSSLHSLQNAYQYELDDTTNFISGNSWNSLQKGLLAGETLKLALIRMQNTYMNNNIRRLEIEQIFSLKEIAANWDNFIKNGGDLKFYIGGISKSNADTKFATLFGDYMYYKIKTVDVSIPAVIGPYQTFNATLTQIAATAKKGEEQVAVTNNNKIIISRGINDNGVFPISENDGRYLPFEGNGAISSWTLNMDAALAANVSDIIFTIKFTAK